jgi:hypothetical protein
LRSDGETSGKLPSFIQAGLADYIDDWIKVRQTGLLFPSPFARGLAVVPVSLDRFVPLGPDWLDVGASYPACGVPGEDLGRVRARARMLQFRRFRHTYLQHLVDRGTDIFIVQELADHAQVQTTIDSYVRPRVAHLREAVENLAQYRQDMTGKRLPADEARLPSVNDVLTNACSNPQVLGFNKEGCDYARRCQTCKFLSVDPSHRDEIRAEVLTLRKAVQHFEDSEDDLRAGLAREDLNAWRDVLRRLDDLLDSLEPTERQVAENAIKVISAMRNRMRNGSMAMGSLPSSGAHT